MVASALRPPPSPETSWAVGPFSIRQTNGAARNFFERYSPSASSAFDLAHSEAVTRRPRSTPLARRELGETRTDVCRESGARVPPGPHEAGRRNRTATGLSIFTFAVSSCSGARPAARQAHAITNG